MKSTKDLPQNGIAYKVFKPVPALIDFVESFWMLTNHSETEKAIVVLPDGCFELLFTFQESEPLAVSLLKLQSQPKAKISKSKSVIYSNSFKLLALEYIFKMKISDFKDDKLNLPDLFWDINKSDLTTFEDFVNKATLKIEELTKGNIDERKQNLFQLVNGSKSSIRSKISVENVNDVKNHAVGMEPKWHTYGMLLTL